MLHWIKNTALELIGQGGLGYSFGGLKDTSGKEYCDAVRDFAYVPPNYLLTYSCSDRIQTLIRPMLTRAVVVRQFLPFFSELGTAGFRRWAVRWLPIDSVQKILRIVDVMDRTARLVFSSRMSKLQSGETEEKSFHGGGEGRDLMSILCEPCAYT